MISFESFRAEDGSPIYLQIIKYLKQGVVSGAVADGDELPSRRVLSALTMLQVQGAVEEGPDRRFSALVELEE